MAITDARISGIEGNVSLINADLLGKKDKLLELRSDLDTGAALIQQNDVDMQNRIQEEVSKHEALILLLETAEVDVKGKIKAVEDALAAQVGLEIGSVQWNKV